MKRLNLIRTQLAYCELSNKEDSITITDNRTGKHK